MSADTIQSQYDQLESVAQRFARSAADSARLTAAVQRSMSALRGNWVGRGSDAFFAEMDDKVLPALRRLADALQAGDKTTQQMLAIMQAAEQDAAAPFQRREDAAVPLNQGGGEVSAGGGGGGGGGGAAGGGGGGGGGGAWSDGPAVNPAALEDAVKQLDDILKPIKWISDSKEASKTFDETMKQIGRVMNSVFEERGNIKMMGELGDFLKGASNVTDKLGTLFNAKDIALYYSGHLSNKEMADTAIKVLFPVPFINDKVADWLTANMPDPDGHWHGLVTPVY